MPSINDAFPSKYMKASDLRGRRVLATIESARLDNIGSGADVKRKLHVDFAEPGLKTLVLNLVNARAISDIAGTDDYTEWPGTRIVLVPSRTTFQGKEVACCRIEAPKAAPKKKAAAPPEDDDDFSIGSFDDETGLPAD